MSLQYPLLFPYGEDGYRTYLKYSINNSNNIGKEKEFL